MKKVDGLFRSFWFYSVLSVFLTFLIVFLSLPQPLKVFALGSNSSITSSTITPPPAFVDVSAPQTATPQQPPITTTGSASPDQDSSISSASNKVTLTIPKGAVTAQTDIEMDEYTPEASTGMVILNEFDLSAKQTGSGTSVSQFSKDLQITITHTAAELAGLDTSTLKLYYLDPKTNQWIPVTSTFDSKTLTLTATTNHFSHYGEQAAPTIVGPGKVMAAQVDMGSGTAMYSYPLELPAGPGGFKPSIELSYNSGSADEMKNKQDVGSWVGIGWSLALGSISYSSSSGIYTLDFTGGSCELFTLDGTNYSTQPNQNFKITRSGNTWEVLDKDGVYYRFGGTTDSKQYLPASLGGYYRWDLSLMRDTNGNQISVSYIQDIMGTSPDNWVRSAYPEYVTYGSVQIHFISSYDVDDQIDGPIRNDDPKSTIHNPAPKVMENRRLTSIEINVGTTLVRKYNLAYNTTNRVSSTDYSGIYYAGEMTLSSITQIGADGTSSMPAMSFTYQDLQIFRQSSADTYTGNPGNPASLNWAHLTEINSGYGGTIDFAYSQTPSTSSYDVWTREVVTSKTVNPGIGATQTTYYTYTGNPQYFGTSWDQQYRGFGEVTETDAAGNYTQHYFYTTGTVNGNDAEKLTGKEYDTKYYNAATALLREVTDTWSANDTAGSPVHGVALNSWSFSGSVIGMATSPNGLLYVLSSSGVKEFDNYGTQIASWSCGQQPTGISISPDGTVWISCDVSYVRHYSSSGVHIDDVVSHDHDQFLGVAVPGDGCVYVLTANGYRVKAYYYNGNLKCYWAVGQSPYACTAIAATTSCVYVAGTVGSMPSVYDTQGNYISNFAVGNSVSAFNGMVYVSSGTNVTLFTTPGYSWTCSSNVYAVAAAGGQYTFAAGNGTITKYQDTTEDWNVCLTQSDTIVGSKTSQTRYVYDSYGNVVTEYDDGDTSTNSDNSTIQRVYYPNTTLNIIDKPASETTYDSTGTNIVKQTNYYYDGNNTSLTTPPTVGNLTRQQDFATSSTSTSTYYTYDSYGNMLTSQDGNGNTTTWAYETTYHTYPTTKTYPITGMSESYTFDPGTDNMLTKTDINGQTTTYQYDTFKRQIATIKPGDTSQSPSIIYDYNNWGTINQQNLETDTKISGTTYTWDKQYYDGLGRVVQVQDPGETNQVVITSTTIYNNLGLTDKQYVSQVLASSQVNGYTTPDSSWKYTENSYDGLGRVTTQTNADSTTVSNDYSNPWEKIVTDERGYATDYFYDAFNRLTQVSEPIQSQGYYAYDLNWGNSGFGGMNNPQGLASSGGSVYVVDSGNGLAEKWDSSDNLTLSISIPGSGVGIAKTSTYAWVVDSANNCIEKFNSSGTMVNQFGTGFNNPWGIAVVNEGSTGYVYVSDTGNNRIQQYTAQANTYYSAWGTYGTGNGQFNSPKGVALTNNGSNLYVVDSGNNRVQEFSSTGTYVTQWGAAGSGNGQFNNPTGIAIGSGGNVYVVDTGNNRVEEFSSSGTFIGTWGTSGSGNGQFNNPTSIAYTIYGYIWVSDGGNNRIQKFDGSGNFLSAFGHAHTGKGQLYNPEKLAISGSNVYITDSGNNRIQSFDLSGNYAAQWGTAGTGNGQFNGTKGIAFSSATGYMYVVDSGNNRVQMFTTSGTFYSTWGSSGSGNGQFSRPDGIAISGSNNYVVDSGNNRIQEFGPAGSFIRKWGTAGSGNGQFNSPEGIAVDSSGNVYVVDSGNNRVQEFSSTGTFILAWGTNGSNHGQFSSPNGITVVGNVVYVVDTGNNRVQQFSTAGAFQYAWSGDGSQAGAFNNPQDIGVDSSGNVYVLNKGNYTVSKYTYMPPTTMPSTYYSYDVLGNLTRVVDASGNSTSITYNWLSQKTSMTDPDMGYWQYGYDSNGNMTTQTDAKNQTITFVYDALNRLTNKNYQQGSGMTNVTYSYDSTAGGNYGKGQRTGMTDAAGTESYTYDTRGRLIAEQRTISGTNYTTDYTYDGLDRIETITYPTGETVTNSYNGRGLPYSVSGSVAGNLVTSALYNQLGSTTEIDLGNTLKTTYGYYGLGGTYDTTGGYYGKLWEIQTLPQAGGTPIQDLQYTWDASGNITQLQDLPAMETESFTYDSVDRLTGASGAYSQSYTYSTTGNITSLNGTSYTYGTKPQAVTSVGTTTYAYDANGNMTDNGGQGLTWDVENRPTAIGAENYVYDGDGNRIEKTVGGVTTLYINKYYELNTGTSTATTSYYLGDKLVATREGTTLTYIHQDSLGSTSTTSNSTGALVSSIHYTPYGTTRSGGVSTDKQFTGQRLDGTGLYYYNARYYNPVIGRFVSPDTTRQNNISPQTLNRYSYVGNNPLTYADPTGHVRVSEDDPGVTSQTVQDYWKTVGDLIVEHPSLGSIIIQTMDNFNPVTDLESATNMVDLLGNDYLPAIEHIQNDPPSDDSAGPSTTNEWLDVAVIASDGISAAVPLPPVVVAGGVLSAIFSFASTVLTINDAIQGKATAKDVTVSVVDFLGSLDAGPQGLPFDVNQYLYDKAHE